jgi:hypothetical protein
VLFLDELHTILGAGNAEGAMDAANILKPMLTRGELHIIGATTLAEYRKIERDSALARRFSPVMGEEPSVGLRQRGSGGGGASRRRLSRARAVASCHVQALDLAP